MLDNSQRDTAAWPFLDRPLLAGPDAPQVFTNRNWRVVQITELAPLALMPNFLLQRQVVRPMQHHVGGTILAAGLAVERGWAINLGGGMHHASARDGMGWCAPLPLPLPLSPPQQACVCFFGSSACCARSAPSLLLLLPLLTAANELHLYAACSSLQVPL